MSLGENGPQSSGEGTRDAIRPLQALLAAAILTPIVLFCGAGFLTYNNFFAEARERNAQLLDIASQNALNIFGTASLAVDRIADRTAGMSWDEIARSRDVYLFLRQIKTNLPQVGRRKRQVHRDDVMIGADHSDRADLGQVGLDLPQEKINVARTCDLVPTHAGSAIGDPIDRQAGGAEDIERVLAGDIEELRVAFPRLREKIVVGEKARAAKQHDRR